MQGDELVRAWRAMIAGPGKSWGVFENGTCVVLTVPGPDLAAQAVELLREWGPVHGGSSFGDFGVIELEGGRGWVVTGHQDDVLTHVGRGKVSDDAEDLAAGQLSRSKRGRDTEELRVLNVEDRRPPAGGA